MFKGKFNSLVPPRDLEAGDDASQRRKRIKNTYKAPKSITVEVPPLDSKKARFQETVEDKIIMKEMEKEYGQVFMGGFTMMPVLKWLFFGFKGARVAEEAKERKAGLHSALMLHKWIKPPTSDEYAIQFFSGMSRIFLPLLTIFSTCLLAMITVGEDQLELEGNEMWGILGFTLALSILILLGMVGAICKRYIYYRLLRHGVLIDFRNPTGLLNFFAGDRYMVTVLSVGYAVWATYTVAQQDGSAADLIAPVITAIAQCLLLISYNSFVLNIETTSLITLNGLVENAKATYGNSDKYVQGALAFLISPYGIMTEDEDDKIQKEYAVEGVKAENVEQIYLKTNLRNCVQRVRNERATYLMSKLGMPLGNSPDFYINVAKDRSPERLQELRRVAQNFIIGGLVVGFEDLEDKLPPSMTEEEQQRYNKAERKVLRAINYAFGYTWGAFLRNLVDLLTFLPLRRYAYVEEISERVYFAFNDLISWSHGVDHEVGGKGSIEDPDKPTYWSNNDVLCVGWHSVMNAEFGRVAHNKWLEERKQQERDTSKVNVFFGELRWRDFISRAILGDYYFFLSDNALASVDDQAFSCLATQLSYIALTVVGGFMAYIGYLVDVGVDDA